MLLAYVIISPTVGELVYERCLVLLQIVDLKAALYRKQQEVKKDRLAGPTDGSIPLTKRVSEKVKSNAKTNKCTRLYNSLHGTFLTLPFQCLISLPSFIPFHTGTFDLIDRIYMAQDGQERL